MIEGMFDNGALPTLERMIQFTGKRHRILTDNIANLSTPFFKPTDLDPKAFQAQLDKAVQQRRRTMNPTTAPMHFRSNRQIQFHQKTMGVNPNAMNENILFHDQNNRDLNRIMGRLAENTLTHNAAISMARNQLDMLNTAIRERL